jgi:tetratricopeptide (TPR) repeat protein
MPPAALSFPVLGLAAFALAASLEPWFQSWAGNRAKSADVLSVALGDSRRLFAKHFYVKADAYFHSGYYPTIYDTRPTSAHTHMAFAAGAAQDEPQQGDFLGKPKDWLDAFSRHFYPTTHRHLGEDSDEHEHAHSAEPAGAHSDGGEEREILPWLRISAHLDPEQPETYIIASFWLRSRLGKFVEAERFLREGLQANPGNCEILLELGHIAKENRKDPERARNLWELALRDWREKEASKPDPNIFVYAQILGALAKLEEEQKNYPKALEYLALLKEVSPNKASIAKWMEDLRGAQSR